MKKKFKILLSAYACEPNKGSEAEVGWKWATTLSLLGHEVYVITRRNNKEHIELYLSKNEYKKLNFIYFDYPKWFLKIFKGKSNSYPYLYYFFWQIGIFFSTKSLIRKINFDFIHHVTWVSYRFPSFLCLHKIPFIFGPVSGGENSPKILKKNFPAVYKLKEFLRDLSNLYIKISPLINLTLSKSHRIFVCTEESKKIIPLKYHHKTEVLLAIGIEKYLKKNTKSTKNKKNFNLIFAGILEPRKGISILLKTFSLIKNKNKNVILNIVGSGSMLSSMKKEAAKLNLNNSINWLGQINRSELIDLFHNNDILIAPYLRDSGGFILLEAMSTALPVATLNIGGPALIVDNKCGVLIDVKDKNENQITSELALKINELIHDNEKLIYKKKLSLEKIEEFSWEKKILRLYK